jgi:hypothetical protein
MSNNTLIFELLEEGWSYYSLPNNLVLAIKADLTKVEEMKGDNGSPVMDESGNPLFKIHAQNVVKVISEDEYQSIRDSENKSK